VNQTTAEWLAEYSQHTEDNQMPSIDDVFPSTSNHLKADDLKGKAVKVTISGYEIVEFKGNNGPEAKPVLKFEGKEKTLVCNKTNSRMIAKNVGSKELDDWVGQTITIYPTETDFGGDIVPCLRVKEEIPEVDELDDPIPF